MADRLLANVPGKAGENDPDAWVPAPQGDPDESPGPWLQPDPALGHLGRDPADRGTPFLLFSL